MDKEIEEIINNKNLTNEQWQKLIQDGRKDEAMQILQKYQEEFKRYSAYRKCIQNEIEKSSIEI